jgi:hypothetical protein
MFIAIVNGQTVEQVGDYQVLFPNTSFPATGPTPKWMAENSCMYVNTYLPYDQSTQVLTTVAPYILVADPTKPLDWVYTVKVEQMTPEQLAQYRQSIAAQNKTKAANLLSQTDWTAIPDVADPLKSDPYLVNQAEFVAWRSNIRAIAVTPTWDAVFLAQPNEVWSNQPTPPSPTPTGSFTVNLGTASTTITLLNS